MGTLIGRDLATLLREALAAQDETVGADGILAWDLMAYDTQGAAVGGSDGEWLFARRKERLWYTADVTERRTPVQDGGRTLAGVDDDLDVVTPQSDQP